MERRIMMEEEFITKAILKFLRGKGYTIIAFDFPQSGTGILLHPATSVGKNEGIIPDIIAAKENNLVVMENKNRFVKHDFEKLHDSKLGTEYTQDLKKLLTGSNTTTIKVGVGLPHATKCVGSAIRVGNLVDFIITVDEQGKCEVVWGSV